MLGRVECLRRKGQPLNRNEEHLFSQLEKMKDEIVKPGQYNNRLFDLVSSVKSESESNDLIEYPSLDEDTIEKVQDVSIIIYYFSSFTYFYFTSFYHFFLIISLNYSCLSRIAMNIV
jgi:hypothetical protein